jgi:PAS domain S-box-containing protein
MSRIALLASNDESAQLATETLNRDFSEIRIEKGLLSQGVAIAEELVKTGTEIIIARAGTVEAIRKAGIEVTLVEVPITAYDILRTIEKARLHGLRIGALTYFSLIQNTAYLAQALNVDIRIYAFKTASEAETKLHQAFREGVDIVMVGDIGRQLAIKNGYPFEWVSNSSESIMMAVQEAKRIEHARNLEKTKTSLFQAVLNYTYDGIISVDREYHVNFFNPIAENITGIESRNAMGKSINDIWPELNLEQDIRSGQDDIGHISKVNGNEVICNKIAIVVNDDIVGAVVTFQDVKQIQQMDVRVRQRIHDSGHVASFRFSDLEKTSAELMQTINAAKEFSLAQSSIFILGETGTGKEVFAQSIHNYSNRNKGPFVAINCAALPTQILESELFGYVGGAFTSANPKGKTGLFEVAHEGTIFLDEIAEMDYATQGKLLRVLQEKKVMRLGSDQLIPIDVRVIAATNKDADELVASHKFRADLYYRLNVLPLQIPPLRERKEDIRLIAQLFLKEHASIIKRNFKFTPAALQVLTEYAWPGNVRELKNVIERIIAINKRDTIEADFVSQMIKYRRTSNSGTGKKSHESEEIKKALALTKWKYIEAAKILGMDRSTLWRKIKLYGLK